MAEGFLRKLIPEWSIFSAGTIPANKVNSYAIEVMKEAGIDISKQYPKLIDEFIERSFDYVITVCDNAKESCPVFTGNVKERIHTPFEDPVNASGTDEQKKAVYRDVRDKIMEFAENFAKNNIIVKDKNMC